MVCVCNTAPCVVLGQVEDELRAHGVAALRHAEHVEGGRVGERHVAQLGAGDAQALRGICRQMEGGREREAYSVQLRTPPKSPQLTIDHLLPQYRPISPHARAFIVRWVFR